MAEFTLPDMSCGHCVSTVTRALKDADPACAVQIDLSTKTVRVQSSRSAEVLASALSEAGYPPG